MSTYKQLLAAREELEQRIEKVRKEEMAGAVNKVRELVEQYGLSEADIFPKPTRKGGGVKTPVAPKYRDPATGNTWTGRGKPPLWIAGKDREAFAI